MKKKLALLLAAVMVLSPISAFAATSNRVDSAKAGIPKKTVYMQKEWVPTAGGYIVGLDTKEKTDDVEYLMNGSDFVINVNRDKLKPGDAIALRLENAEWFFRNAAQGTVVNSTLALVEGESKTTVNPAGDEYETVITSSPYYESLPDAIKTYIKTRGGVDFHAGKSDPVSGNKPYNYRYDGVLASVIDGKSSNDFDSATFDKTKGQLLNLGTDTYAYLHNGKTLAKPINLVSSTEDIPYVIIFNIRTPQVATLYVLSDSDNIVQDVTATATSAAAAEAKAKALFAKDNATSYGGQSDIINLIVPLVTLATGEGEAKIIVANYNQTTQVTGGSYVFGNASGSGTKTTVEDVTTSKYDFELSNFKITENAIASLNSKGSAVLTAPYGYTWADPSGYTKDAKKVSLSTDGAISLRIVSGNAVVNAVTQNNTSVPTDTDFIGYLVNNKGEKDKQRLLIDLQGFGKTGVSIDDVTRWAKGTLILDNLRLIADDYASYDVDISVGIADLDVGAYNVSSTYKTNGYGKLGVTSEDVKVAVRKDWGVTLTVDKDKIPTLFNGRFEFAYDNNAKRVDATVGQYRADSNADKNHKAATVTFKENVVASWWSQRQTDLTLNEGVKYIQVKIGDVKNVDTDKIIKLAGEYPFSEKKDGNVHVTGNKVTLTNIYLKANSTASFTIQSWISIEAGYEGDVVMTAAGSAISEDTKDGPSVVIAKAINPVNIATTVTDVRISLQNQKVADITLTETAPGALLMNRELVLSVYDDISQDGIYFDNSSIVYEKTGNVSFSRPVAKAGNITTVIDRISDKDASSIKFSNIYVKTDRNVPESNERPYRVYVGGNAVVNNYEESYRGYQPYFSTRGVHADFLNVVTQADETIGALASDVKFTVGDTSVWIGRTTPREIVMDTAPYVSATSNSLMLPVRYVAAALGIPKDAVLWDEANRTVTILVGTKVIQFTLDSSTIKVNGAEYTMYSLDTPPLVTSAETKDDRAFLPVRQIAIALGVNVEWNQEDQTATFNTNKYKANPGATDVTNYDETDKTTAE